MWITHLTSLKGGIIAAWAHHQITRLLHHQITTKLLYTSPDSESITEWRFSFFLTKWSNVNHPPDLPQGRHHRCMAHHHITSHALSQILNQACLPQTGSEWHLYFSDQMIKCNHPPDLPQGRHHRCMGTSSHYISCIKPDSKSSLPSAGRFRMALLILK